MLGALIGAGASLASTFLGNKSKEQANDQAAAQAAANIAHQKEFAQNGIQWKVEDAKKAGLHPLFALGASTHSFSPVSAGTTASDFSGLADAGQNIGRAIDATRDPASKQAASLQTAFAATQLEGAQLDNDIKRARLASAIATNQTGTGGGIPIPGGLNQFDGQGNAIPLDNKGIKIESRRDATDPTNPTQIPGSGPSVGYVKLDENLYGPVMPPELAESYESDHIGRWDWQIRNRVLPFISQRTPPNVPHDRTNQEVVFNPFRNGWEVRNKPRNMKWGAGLNSYKRSH